MFGSCSDDSSSSTNTVETGLMDGKKLSMGGAGSFLRTSSSSSADNSVASSSSESIKEEDWSDYMQRKRIQLESMGLRTNKTTQWAKPKTD